MWPIILLLLGVTLVFLELFVPSGGVISVVAALAVASAVVLAFMESTRAGAAMLIAVAVLLPAAVALALRIWPRTPLGRRILLSPEQDGSAGADDDPLRQLVGRRGRAKTEMLPGGLVEVDGRTWDALSEGGPIEAGRAVRVAAVRMGRLIVQPAEDQPQGPLSQPVDRIAPDPFQDPLA